MIFWEKVDTSGDCWLWRGYVMKNGYGMCDQRTLVHRFSWETVHGPIPAGLVIDHICRVRNCVRPDHLRVVTQRENVLAPGSESPAATKAAQERCVHNHLFSSENTRIRPNGTRACISCNRQAARHQYQRRKSVGACRICFRPPENGRTRCAKHLEMDRLYQMRRRAFA
jgi:hypothetical protein